MTQTVGKIEQLTHEKPPLPDVAQSEFLNALLDKMNIIISNLHEEVGAGDNYRNLKSVDIRFEFVETQDPSGEYDSRLVDK